LVNLLAHALLSGDDPGMIVGGVLADWIKGPVDRLPGGLIDGIRRHRQVDTFTDGHPTTAVSRARLRDRWGRYSGILVDLAYDVCLAATWDRFGRGRMGDFIQGTYAVLERSISGLPRPACDVARYMIAEDWLTSYGGWDGVATALGRITRRLRRPVNLTGAVEDLKRLESELTEDFVRFYPDLEATCPSSGR
jgi:acyl carrier protein phosphodiesterase